jgi:argininosuccinate lyase
VLPLGSGAIAGSAYPISRLLLQQSLGFSSVSQNSIDAVGDRDFVAEMLFVIALMATHLSRLAEDLILYGSSEFGFVKFGEAFTTGSSMMPQKRNPDALELARASAPRALGDLVTMLGVLKGLPSGYNKDLQEDKRALFDAADLMRLVLPAVEGALAELTFDETRMRLALSSTIMATDLADYLVKKGSSFRQAHEAVGSLIQEAERHGCELGDLSMDSFSAASPLFGPDIHESLDPENSIARRDIPGGTGPEAVRAQLDLARAALAPD